MSGWVKIHRGIVEWEWYDDTPTFRLFLHLILKANHKDKRYRGRVIKRGSLLTGRELLASQTGLSVQQVRTSLNKLKLTNEITINSSTQGTEIQLVKYNDYQLLANEVTNEQPTTNQRLTTNKKDKKEKNLFRAPEIQEVLDYCNERKNNVNAQTFIDFYTAKGWYVGKNKMKDWKAAVRTWERSSHKNQSSGSDDYVTNVMKQIK